MLLVVFTIGVTPKKYLHDLFSQHTDCTIKQNSEQQQLNNYKFNCGFVNVIATSPFIETADIFQNNLRIYSFNYLKDFISPLNTFHFNCFEHRGPPQG